MDKGFVDPPKGTPSVFSRRTHGANGGVYRINISSNGDQCLLISRTQAGDVLFLICQGNEPIVRITLPVTEARVLGDAIGLMFYWR